MGHGGDDAPYEGFLEWSVPKNGWLRIENPNKVDDLGVRPYKETSISVITIFWDFHTFDYVESPYVGILATNSWEVCWLSKKIFGNFRVGFQYGKDR